MVAGLLATAPPAGQADGTLGGLVAVTTDYVFRGVSQTRGGPATQAGLQYRVDAGWFVGAWGSTVDLNPGEGATVELNLFGGRAWQINSGWEARLTAVHYAYPNDTERLRYDYDELMVSVAWRDAIIANVAWSPNTSRYSSYGKATRETAVTIDLVGRWSLHPHWVVFGGLGHYDLDALFGTSYQYGSFGIAGSFAPLDAQLAYHFTSDRAKHLFGQEVAGDRWSLTATWRF
ncbi:MAG: TorF family putative porin [Steroidobacteraceae bacterium]|nr:TorF family putative porin [Steroidobacteraceae bacterium]